MFARDSALLLISPVPFLRYADARNFASLPARPRRRWVFAGGVAAASARESAPHLRAIATYLKAMAPKLRAVM